MEKRIIESLVYWDRPKINDGEELYLSRRTETGAGPVYRFVRAHGGILLRQRNNEAFEAGEEERPRIHDLVSVIGSSVLLLVILTVLPQPFAELAFPAAVQVGLVPVLAKVLGDIIPFHAELCVDSNSAECLD